MGNKPCLIITHRTGFTIPILHAFIVPSRICKYHFYIHRLTHILIKVATTSAIAGREDGR